MGRTVYFSVTFLLNPRNKQIFYFFQVDRPINAKLKPRLKPLNMNTVDVNLPAVKRSDPATPKTPCTPLSANSVFDYENRNPLSPNLSSPCGNFVEPRRPSSIRKPQKRIRSPNLDGECSPGM